MTDSRSLTPLPIDPLIPEIVSALRTSTGAVVLAPPGAGKTTRIPPALAAAPWLRRSEHPAVVLLQPRRVAARAAAARIGEEQGWRLGHEVGYHIRFDNRTTPRTRVRVLTEGILTRQIQSDPFLEGIGCVILDEFHERSIHTDLALALLREVQTTVREDLRIVVMSATMDPRPVARFLGDVPVFDSPGRIFPVEIRYLERPDSAPVWEKAASAVRRALDVPASDSGHVLVFLPGIGEIRRTEGLLRESGADLHVLHSSVPADEQDRTLRPSPRRKVILATNIAETSLTIDGVRTVIDSGLVRVLVHDARLGIDRLELRRISRASATQRSGRAGRTAPGRCLRLWTDAEQSALEEHAPPEIHLIDLASMVLTLRAYGVRDLDRFNWFEPPRPENLARAERFLAMLGATAPDGTLSPLGRRLASLPLHPRLGRLLLAGADAGLPREAATLAALLSERDILASPHESRRREAGWEGNSDLLDRLEAFERGRHSPAFDTQAVRAVERVRDELTDLVRRQHGVPMTPSLPRDEALRRALLLAYPDRVTVRRPHDPARGLMVGGRGIVLEPSSVVRRAPLFLSLDPRDPVSGDTTESRVSLASAVEAEWLEESFPHLLERRLASRFDPERGRVLTHRQTVFAGLVVRETGARPSDDPEGTARALYEHLRRDPAALFEADEEVARWLARVRLLRSAMPELGLPDFTSECLDDILREACAGATSLDQVRGAELLAHLENRLTWPQRSALDEHAPKALEVPSGNRIRLQYPADGPPVLAVRIQELFGLPENPRVAAGRVPVVLHLLGPNYRPVQVTSDLRSFWNTTYAEVRKELRARYPRHPWPEDPWNAPAVSVGGRRRG